MLRLCCLKLQLNLHVLISLKQFCVNFLVRIEHIGNRTQTHPTFSSKACCAILFLPLSYHYSWLSFRTISFQLTIQQVKSDQGGNIMHSILKLWLLVNFKHESFVFSFHHDARICHTIDDACVSRHGFVGRSTEFSSQKEGTLQLRQDIWSRMYCYMSWLSRNASCQSWTRPHLSPSVPIHTRYQNLFSEKHPLVRPW